MTISSAMPEGAAPHAHPFTMGAHARVLATALIHLLDRDEGAPARWHTDDFAAAVDDWRSALRSVADHPAARMVSLDPGREVGFDEAATRLARDPLDVAAALLHLERERREQLPGWTDLVRRGMPARDDRDAALWFG